jgi:ferric-dicitrate binding protein FerR (iron transport regulator)
LIAQKLALDRQKFPAQVSQRIADYERGQDELNDQVADLRSIAESEIEQPARWTGSSSWVRAALALGSLAAVTLLALALTWWPRSPQAVAKVLEVEGNVATVVGQGARRAIAGEAVLTDQVISTPSGASLTIGYADGTSVRIGENSSLAISTDAGGAKRIGLHRGTVAADVVPQSAGAMTFKTPHAIATVLGTQLRLHVTSGSTLLEVTEGKVRLNRPADGRSIDVSANETGLATSELLQVRGLHWPDSREGLMYLLSPLAVGDLPPPAMVARNPATGGLIETRLTLQGNAQFDNESAALVLAGGFASSAEAGTELLPVWRKTEAFTLEIVLAAEALQPDEEACVVSLGPVIGANFALLQRGQDLAIALHDPESPADAALQFSLPAKEKPAHVTIVYRDGKVLAYRDGEEIVRGTAAVGLPSRWADGPLTLGGDAKGLQNWMGTMAALAIYNRALDPAEVQQNARNFASLMRRGEE